MLNLFTSFHVLSTYLYKIMENRINKIMEKYPYWSILVSISVSITGNCVTGKLCISDFVA